ncbi:hypothetical protein MKSMC1_29470 [Mycobacterium kansasii]|nr:hypothetical protein MKSMC1_29470 [Mycobacterium kansasii]
MGQPLVAAGIIPGVVCVIVSVIFSGSFGPHAVTMAGNGFPATTATVPAQ